MSNPTSHLLALLLLIGGAILQASASPEEVDRLLKAYADNQLFNGTCLISERGRIVVERAYGQRDLLSQERNRTDTAFEIASATKPLTATAVLLLAREGKLQLKDEVGRFLPEWPYPGMTLRHLLTHTSGLPDYRAFPRPAAGASPKVQNSDLLRHLVSSRPALQFPPGRGWNYSNTGYVVLAAVIEHVSGQSYGQFLRERLFGPTGMQRSAVAPAVLENQAAGFLLTRHGYRRWWLDPHLDDIVGDGGIRSTAGDLLKFSEAYFSGALLGDLTTEALTALGNEKGPILYRGVGNGLGWNLKYEAGEQKPCAAFHAGNYGGFRAMLWRDLKNDRSIILLDNANHPLDEVVDQINAVLGGKPWTKPRKSIVDAMLLTMPEKGIEGALALYRTLSREQAADYRTGERELNTLGYVLLYDGAVDEAIKVFELNIEENPKSFNARDSLAEACLRKGDLAKALAAYEQAVQLNPGFEQGREAIKTLRQRLDAAK